jgi:hypothetical protein
VTGKLIEVRGFIVARGFIPDGLRSSPVFSESKVGPLRDPSGINPLTTMNPLSTGNPFSSDKSPINRSSLFLR